MCLLLFMVPMNAISADVKVICMYGGGGGGGGGGGCD